MQVTRGVCLGGWKVCERWDNPSCHDDAGSGVMSSLTGHHASSVLRHRHDGQSTHKRGAGLRNSESCHLALLASRVCAHSDCVQVYNLNPQALRSANPPSLEPRPEVLF